MSEYNLLTEPWIKVLTRNNETKQMGIREVFENAHDIVTIAGENRLQDFAILGIFIAANISMIYGEDNNTTEGLYSKWGNLWKNGKFNKDTLDKYFDKWSDRFYLFDDKFPFYQIPDVHTDTVEDKESGPWKMRLVIKDVINPKEHKPHQIPWQSAKGINGNILESDNTPSTLSTKVGLEKESMSLDETARWLVYNQIYGANSFKPNPGLSFCGHGVCVYATGHNNLFETIMLNSILVDENDNPYSQVLPIWEKNEVDISMHINENPIVMPTDLPAQLTLQTRRIIMRKSDDNRVYGWWVYSGDYINKEILSANIFPFHIAGKGNKTTPNPVVGAKGFGDAAWNNFERIFASNARISRWISNLSDKYIDEDRNIPFLANAVLYGSSNSCVEAVITDKITVPAKLFQDTKLINDISIEIEKINDVKRDIGSFNRDISKATGAIDGACCEKNFIGRIVPEIYATINSAHTPSELREITKQTALDVIDKTKNNLSVTALVTNIEIKTKGKSESMPLAKYVSMKRAFIKKKLEK